MFKKAEIEITILNDVDVIVTSPVIPMPDPGDWMSYFGEENEE